MQGFYRRTLATAGALVALATIACGSSVYGTPGPASNTVTADSVRAAFDKTNMKSAHFKLHGTLIKKPGYYPVTGDGVLQLRPREGLQMTLRVQTYSSQGVLRIQEVIIGGRIYTRAGTGRWTSKRSSDSLTTVTSYVGDEIIAGTSVWHARSTSGSYVNDIWIRESDGYIVKLDYTSASGNFTMTFDSYNKSPVINVPK